ncbi:gag-pol polyprotein [Tanacetum coccineum]
MIVSTSMIFSLVNSTKYLVSTIDGTMPLKELNSAEEARFGLSAKGMVFLYAKVFQVSNLPLRLLSCYRNGCPTISTHMANSLVVIALHSARSSGAQLTFVVEWPKIEDNDSFELKGHFLKELRDNTFSGSDHEDVNEHIKNVLEIVDLFHIPDITIDQVMLRAFPLSLTRAASHWLINKPSSSITTWEDLKTKQILDSRGVIPSKTAADAKVAIQEMAEYSQKWYNGTSRTRSTETSARLAAIQAQLNNLGREIKKVNEKVYAAQEGDIEQLIRDAIKGTMRILCTKNEEIRASTDAAIRNQGASIKTLEIQIGKISKDFINSGICREDIKVPLILERPFLSTACAKIDVFKRKITLRVGKEKIIFKRRALVLNRSLDPFFEDYIELNDLNVPLELRRDQVDDLMPTIAKSERSMIRRLYDCAYLLEVLLHDRFPVLEDMDDYCVEGRWAMLDFWRTFFREVRINAKWFEGMITIHNGNDEVTYQMDLAERKEIDNVGGESTIWKSGSVGVLKLQNGCLTRPYSINQHGESTEQNIRGVSHSNSF